MTTSAEAAPSTRAGFAPSVAAWLGLAEGEGPRALRLLTLVFTASAALVLAKAAQSGVFLAAYPRHMIPWAFGASAVTLATFSAVSVAAGARVGPVSLATATLLGTSAALFLAFALLTTNVRGAPFVTYVLVEATAGLVLIQIWSVVSETVDPRSGKRLLPLAGVGASLAWTLFGLVVPRVVHKIGATGLLVVAPALFLLALVVVRAIARVDLAGKPTRGARVGLLEGWRSGLSFVAEVPLMRLVLVLSVLGLVAEQLMDFQLMSAAHDRWEHSPANIAAFFGRFYGVTSFVSMIILLGLSGRLLSRLGAMTGLVVAPVATVLAATAAVVVPGFAPMVLLRASDRVLKPALWASAMEQTQTPLPVLRRAQARALIRGVVAPAFYAVVSVVLAALPDDFDLRWLALSTLLVSTVTTAVIVVGVRKRYLQALRRAIDDRRLRLDADLVSAQGATVPLDVDACEALGRELAQADETRALLAAEVLGHGEGPAAARALAVGLDHASAQVRVECAEALARVRASDHAEALAKLLLRDPISEVRRACARALRALDVRGASVRAAFERGLSDTDRAVRATCRVSLLEWDDPSGVGSGEALAPLLDAADPEACEAALDALVPRAVENQSVLEALRAILRTDDRRLRLAVLRTVTRTRARALLPDVAPLLEDARTAPEAVTHLSRWGEGALEEAAVSIAASTASSSVEDAEPVSRLLSQLETGTRDRATRALLRAPRRKPLPRSAIEPVLTRELGLAHELVAIRHGLEKESNEALADEIDLRIREARERVLQLLALRESRKLVAIVEVGMRKTSPQAAAQVAELLDVALPAALARKVVPLFERLSPRARFEAIQRGGDDHAAAAKDPLGALVALNDAHLRACAMVSYGPRYAARFPELFETESALVPLYERMRFLRSVPLFGELPGEDLRTVAEIVETVDLPKGAVIFHKGDPGDDLYVILRGRVAIRDGKIEVATLGEREFFGELSVIDREPRSADAIVVEDAQLLRLRSADLGELMARRPQIQEEILVVLARRLREVMQRVSTA